MVIRDLSTLNRVTQIYAGLRSQTEMEIEKIGNRSPRSPRSNISFPFFFFLFLCPTNCAKRNFHEIEGVSNVRWPRGN